MASNFVFYYLGDDEAYFRALQGEFKRHAKVTIEFRRLYESKESKIQSFFLKIFNDKPACVFIDYSKQTQDYLHLARIISRTPLEHSMLMVGLVDYLSPPELLRESITTGANLSFIKSAETYDVVFSVTKLIAPQSIGESGFANAKLNEELEAGVLCKIGYVHAQGLHIETDYKLDKGDRVILNHHWLEKRIVPSKHAFVTNCSSSNMFYQFKYNADLDFMFIDDFIPPEGMEELTIHEKQAERDELVVYHKKQLKRWLEDNVSGSLEKGAKVLVVDYNFHVYQNQARTDKHPYTIRCIPFFNDIQVEIDRLRPQVIAFEMQTDEKAKNNMESLRNLVGILLANFSDLKPYIIVFSTKESSQDLQASLQYGKVLGHEAELSPDLLMKLADMLQKKMSGEVQMVSKKDEQHKVFIKKNNLASVGEILKSITVVKLSETDMVLQSEFPFPPGSNLHFTKPVEMFVNIQPSPKPSGKIPEYYGLIHSLGETEKKELRRYVNSIFFREHDAKLSAETEQFKQLNEVKLQEKVATKQKESEDAAANAEFEQVTEPDEPDKAGEG